MISLISGIYKIVAKVLATRLSKVIGEVISRNQSTFIGDHNILDGVLVANEVVDEARKEIKQIFIFQINFEKAYDSVSWSYLLGMLKLLNFGGVWCGGLWSVYPRPNCQC